VNALCGCAAIPQAIALPNFKGRQPSQKQVVGVDTLAGQDRARSQADLVRETRKLPPATTAVLKQGSLIMKSKTISALAAVLALGCFGTAALAADGLPDDPTSNATTIPGPNVMTPSDPAANDNPAARVPTTKAGYRVSGEAKFHQEKKHD
jgi:hypothetical protein